MNFENFYQAQIEVERLDVLKKSKMKELVMKKRMELEEVCKSAHLEPDANTAAEKLIAAIDSGTESCHRLRSLTCVTVCAS